VEKARSAAAETSGATSGAKVAAYLRGEAEVKPAAEKVLERLTLPAAAEPKEEPMPAVPSEPAVDTAKLAALGQSVAPMTAPPSRVAADKPQPAEQAPKPEDLARANEKLSSLLGNKQSK
jgi:hypothetical protein